MHPNRLLALISLDLDTSCMFAHSFSLHRSVLPERHPPKRSSPVYLADTSFHLALISLDLVTSCMFAHSFSLHRSVLPERHPPKRSLSTHFAVASFHVARASSLREGLSRAVCHCVCSSCPRRNIVLFVGCCRELHRLPVGTRPRAPGASALRQHPHREARASTAPRPSRATAAAGHCRPFFVATPV